MNNTAYAASSQGLGLPEFSHSGLTGLNKTVYSLLAVAKSAVGIRTPQTPKAHRRQHLYVTGFFMRKICAHLSNSLGKLHSNYGGLDEAAKAGRFFGAVVRTLFSSPPVMRFEPHGGDLKLPKEAVIMTTTPTQAVTTAMIYTFLIAGGVRTLSTIKRIRTVSVVAQSELLARQHLAGLPLVFVSRTLSQSMGVSA
jgi:hypothetical protein